MILHPNVVLELQLMEGVDLLLLLALGEDAGFRRLLLQCYALQCYALHGLR
jgi:hypothetical protein